MSFEKEFEKDGVFDKIFHFLWSYSDYFKEDVARLKINIPDTVIFENTHPINWYYTDSNGYIRKKKTENLLFENIKEKFLSKISKSNIVAYFIHNALFIGTTKFRQSKIEYFDEENFLNFLNNRTNSPSGILQKFIDPAEEYNSKT